MEYSKEEAREKIDKFSQKCNADKKKLQQINEENTKDYIDEIFRLLGWDLIDDVIKEYGTGKRKRVDYAFQIHGTTKFLLEAKAYNEDLDKYVGKALEYGFQNNKTWVVLTNLREIRIYNARYFDKEEQIRRLFDPIKFENIADRFDDLWVLSKEGMKHNLINVLAKKYGKIRPREPISELIYEDLLRWRTLLTKNISKNNRLSEDKDEMEELLDEAVQKILDRIIFIRVCEDRGFEEEDILKWCIRTGKADPKYPISRYLNRLFSKKNEEYDSTLFAQHFSQELNIDDFVLERIIEETYESPKKLKYDFSAIDADILGSIYENYLAFIQKRVKYKEAKQKTKRKSQGIYYTPTYIVDYIVKNTLGEKLKNCKKPEDALKIKVLDPACGSGSFLIRAYDEFKNWYKIYKQKTGKAEQTKLDLDSSKGTQTFMDSVLENCLYGVDLDEKAVEIAQLNLLLKAAEQKHKLPKLSNTIRCGNSLISEPTLAGDKAFKWKEKFYEIFNLNESGFDIIIGNPPYGADLTKEEKKYLHDMYPSVPDYETADYFLEKSIELNKKSGFISFIIPNTFLVNINAEKLRKDILKKTRLYKIVELSNFDVFENPSVRTCILVLNKEIRSEYECFIDIYLGDNTFERFLKIDKKRLTEQTKNWLNLCKPLSKIDKILTKIKTESIILSKFCSCSQGLIPYDKYRGHSEETIRNRIWHSDIKKNETYKKELRGGDVKRYKIKWNGKQWISYGPWLAAPRKIEYFTKPRILIREITDPKDGKLNAAYTEDEYYNNPGIINCISTDKEISLKYLLGIINSKLIAFYHLHSSPKAKKGLFPKILVNDVRNLPIKITEKHLMLKLERLVEQMINLNDRLELELTNKKIIIEQELEKTNREIDELVYKIYNMTPEEIKIIEETLK